MKRKLTTLAAVAMASTLAIAAAGMAQAHMGQGQGHGHAQTEKTDKSQPGSEMMGQKKGQGRMMGHGQMGQGHMMGRGMKGHTAGFKREKALSTDEVRRVIDGRLAMSGLSRLKAGTAKDVGETATEVDVVTEKGDMVFRLKVDRKSGQAVIIE